LKHRRATSEQLTQKMHSDRHQRHQVSRQVKNQVSVMKATSEKTGECEGSGKSWHQEE